MALVVEIQLFVPIFEPAHEGDTQFLLRKGDELQIDLDHAVRNIFDFYPDI